MKALLGPPSTTARQTSRVAPADDDVDDPGEERPFLPDEEYARLRIEKEPGVWSVPIVGESFKNDDGSSRQTIIGQCRIGEAAAFRREPNNPHDPNAIAVLCVRTDQQLGYIGREANTWLGKAMGQNRVSASRIRSISEIETDRGRMLGCILTVNVTEAPKLKRRKKG